MYICKYNKLIDLNYICNHTFHLRPRSVDYGPNSSRKGITIYYVGFLAPILMVKSALSQKLLKYYFKHIGIHLTA